MESNKKALIMKGFDTLRLGNLALSFTDDMDERIKLAKCQDFVIDGLEMLLELKDFKNEE